VVSTQTYTNIHTYMHTCMHACIYIHIPAATDTIAGFGGRVKSELNNKACGVVSTQRVGSQFRSGISFSVSLSKQKEGRTRPGAPGICVYVCMCVCMYVCVLVGV
jgi:hypothetical protein